MDWRGFIRPELAPIQAYQPGLSARDVARRSGRDHVLKLSSNEHPAGPTPAALAAIAAVAAEVNRYSDGGCRELRSALSRHWGVDVAHISVGNGSNELLRLIAQAVVRPGDEVVYPWPSFIVYPLAAAMFGATPVAVPLDAQECVDLDAILAAITRRTRIVFLCNPNNPTGTIYRREAFERFMAAVPDHVLVVLDEAYFEFVTDDGYPDGAAWFDGQRPVAVLRTFSKIYSLAGLRVGYGFLPAALAAAIDKIREPFNVNALAQAAATASLSDTAEVVRRVRENDEQKAAIYDCFERLGIRYVRSHANFVYLATQRPTEVFGALLDEGVIARDFGVAPALRLGIGTPRDTELSITAFENVVARLGSV